MTNKGDKIGIDIEVETIGLVVTSDMRGGMDII